MWTTRTRAGVLAIALGTFGTSTAIADDNPKSKAKSTEQAQAKAKTKAKPGAQKAASSAGAQKAPEAQTSTAEVMQITQQALTHVAAAEQAIDANKIPAAKSALAKSEAALARLYDTPILKAVLNEFDEALRQVRTDRPALKAVDLAPLTASVSTYRAYLDPEVAAGVQDAEARAKAGDAQGAADALKLARNRVVMDMAFLPVEEAYVRVIAAQAALDDGERERAAKFLRTLPIVVSQVQVSTPMVPVRFKLNAAAVAAEEGNWQRSQALIGDANQQLQQLEKAAPTKSPATSEIATISDELERMNQNMRSGTRPSPQQIRQLAQRTRNLGEA